jgi:hypothetical protein
MSALLLAVAIGLLVAHVYRARIKRWWRRVTRRALTSAAPVLAIQVATLWLGAQAGMTLSAPAVVAIPAVVLLSLQARSA